MISERIVELFGQGALKYSALNIAGGEAALEKVLGDRRYRRILEIGTFKGASAACMAQFCERVITIDLRNGLLEHVHPEWDRLAFWAALGIDNIELHLVRNDAKKAEIVAGIDFDFAFIDGAHDKTVEADFALVKRCGAVLFHDYNGDAGDCVSSFVNTLPAHQVRSFGIFALWNG